eukprot:jgi/Chlat1/2425/Chrsp17S02829
MMSARTPSVATTPRTPSVSGGKAHAGGGGGGGVRRRVRGPAAVHAVLLFVQFSHAGYQVLSKQALSNGANEFVFCTFRDLLAVLVVIAAAAALDRGKGRPPVSRKLAFYFFLLGFTGIFANHLLFLVGLKLTSPPYAAAMQPSIPVFTFLLAILLRNETVALRRRDGVAKLFGIAVCVCGAMVMVAYRGPALLGRGSFDALHASLNANHRFLGVCCLLGNCLCMAFYLTLQSVVLRQYPLPISTTAWSYCCGGACIAFTALFVTSTSDWQLNASGVGAVMYGGLVASALNFSLMAWANKQVGPATVALYLPVQPLAATLLSHVFLGTPVFAGRQAHVHRCTHVRTSSDYTVAIQLDPISPCCSLCGGCFILSGLFLVTWGRSESERLAEIQLHKSQLEMHPEAP